MNNFIKFLAKNLVNIAITAIVSAVIVKLILVEQQSTSGDNNLRVMLEASVATIEQNKRKINEDAEKIILLEAELKELKTRK